MVRELSLRINRALSYLSSIESKANSIIEEIDDYVSLHGEELVENIFNKSLVREGGVYVEYSSFGDALESPYTYSTCRHNYPKTKLIQTVNLIKAPYKDAIENVKAISSVLNNYLDGLQYVSTLTSVPENIMALLNDTKGISLRDFKGIEEELKQTNLMDVVLPPKLFTHNKTIYLFTPNTPAVEEEPTLVESSPPNKSNEGMTGWCVVAGIVFAVVITILLNS